MPYRILFLFLFLFSQPLRGEWNVTSADGAWTITENGKKVLVYNYHNVPLPAQFIETVKEPDKKYAVPRSNYIHPLYGLDGKPITHDWAADHPHHRGIYWAWPEVGYKGKLGDLHALQNVFARPNGKLTADEDVKNGVKTGAVILTAENVWKWEDKEDIVHETFKMTVHPLADIGRKIDLEFQFRGLVDEITLARRGTKAYGGLNIRMGKLDGFQSKPFIEAGNRPAGEPLAAWAFGTWKDSAGKMTELTVFERADNPDYPGAYIEYPNLQWFQSTFPKTGTRYSLKKEKTLTLRYQLWLHEAVQDVNAKRSQWEAFQK